MPIDAILVSYEDGDDSPRRKPNPGLLLEAADTYGIDLSRSFMVGDRWRDVEAGRRLDVAPYLSTWLHKADPTTPADHTT